MLKAWSARLLTGALLFSAAVSARGADARLEIYAAEPVYADLAHQIGGPRVQIESAARRSASAREGRSVGARPMAEPRIALINGGGYDPTAAGLRPAQSLEAAQFAPRTSASDRYYWYDLATMRGLAGALAAQLEQDDPNGGPVYAGNLAKFDASLARLDGMIKDVAFNYRGSDIFVTDDLSRRIIDELRFRIVDPEFTRDRASPKDVDALRSDIAERKASILIYDSDTKAPLTSRLVALAKDSGVPTVGVRESLPAALTYQEWMIREINAIHGALNEAAP